MPIRSYHGPITALLSASLMFGLICGCGGSNDMSSGTASYSDRADVSSSAAYTASPAKRSESTPAGTSAPPASASPTAPPAAGEVYSSSPKDHASNEAVGAGTSPAEASSHTEDVYREKEFVPRSRHQSGLLTAGSFDDVANYHEYLQLLRTNQHHLSDC